MLNITGRYQDGGTLEAVCVSTENWLSAAPPPSHLDYAAAQSWRKIVSSNIINYVVLIKARIFTPQLGLV